MSDAQIPMALPVPAMLAAAANLAAAVELLVDGARAPELMAKEAEAFAADPANHPGLIDEALDQMCSAIMALHAARRSPPATQPLHDAAERFWRGED